MRILAAIATATITTSAADNVAAASSHGAVRACKRRHKRHNARIRADSWMAARVDCCALVHDYTRRARVHAHGSALCVAILAAAFAVTATAGFSPTFAAAIAASVVPTAGMPPLPAAWAVQIVISPMCGATRCPRELRAICHCMREANEQSG